MKKTNYHLTFSNTADAFLQKAGAQVRSRLVKKLEFFMGQENPLSFAEKLKGFRLYRFRIGDYRAVIHPEGEKDFVVVLFVIDIDHRKQIYKKSSKWKYYRDG